MIELFLTQEFLEGESILSLINQLLKTLPIEKSKQHRLKVLVSDIDKNRVESVLTRLPHAHEEEDKRNVLQQSVCEHLLSEGQRSVLQQSVCEHLLSEGQRSVLQQSVCEQSVCEHPIRRST